MIGAQSEAAIPYAQEAAQALNHLRKMHAYLTDVIFRLEGRAKSSMVDATDGEMAAHKLFVRESLQLTEDVTKKLKSLDQWNANRANMILMGRGSLAFLALGHVFEIDVELLPGMPKKNEPDKKLELLDWMRRSPYADSIMESIHFKTMQRICEELAEKGEPAPPHVKLYPKAKLKARKSR